MRYDANHKERTRARVLAEAASAIKSKGVERVGVVEVMAGAALTHGGSIFAPAVAQKVALRMRPKTPRLIRPVRSPLELAQKRKNLGQSVDRPLETLQPIGIVGEI